ncbi:MAG: IS5 family transposase [bacterium]|nr:IS5 family transposase [bacterium]
MTRRRFDLTKEQWQRLEPVLPPQKPKHAGKPPHSHRKMLNGMLWVLRTGAPWRDLPRVYGSWKSVHTRFLRWSKAGVLQVVLDELAKDADDEFTSIDGSLVRVHQDATGGKKPAPSALGRPEADRRRRSMRLSMRSGTHFESCSAKVGRTTCDSLLSWLRASAAQRCSAIKAMTPTHSSHNCRSRAAV